jgi:hypothetical protein
MPLHAQIICFGGNALIGLLMVIGACMEFSSGDFGTALFMALLAVASAYTLWVLVKFRRYLSEEATLERQAHMAQLRQDIAASAANTPLTPPGGPIP